MTRPSTFRRRLATRMALLAVAVLALASLLIYVGARRVLRDNLDEALLAIARTEVASALDGPGGRVHVHDERWVPISLPGHPGYEKFAVIRGAQRQIIAQTTNVAAGPPLQTEARREQQALEGKASFGTARQGSARLRALYYPLRDAGGAALVAIVAVPTEAMERSLSALLGLLAFVLALGGGAAAWGARRLAARLTTPLERIAAAAQSIDAGGATRIPQVSDDVELRSLADALNTTLARLQAALAGQQRLVADASHELRSPLTNLRGTVEVALRRSRSAEEYRTALTIAEEEITRLCRLVDDLLTLSRADAGQLRLERRPCDLAALAGATARAHAASADAAGVTLAVETTEPLPVHGDGDRLRSLLDNLLDNALRHAPRGTTVEVHATRDGTRALLHVRDHGAGLAADALAHVFERFYRVDNGRGRATGGAGLGLAIARAIADAHGGTLTAASTPGAGATFTLSLPLASTS